jgi:hypothetical protein
VGIKEKIGALLNPWVVAWAIGAAAFALVVVWQNLGLTFFWDEWDVVWATVASPYYGILQDNGGNFFPLSRIVFALELSIFGTWYPGYMLVTSLLFGATAFTFNWLLDDGTRMRRIALSAFALIYLSSSGVLFASSMGFMLKWGLSPLLALISASFFIRSNDINRSRAKALFFAWLFFFLSWAAFSSAIVLMALLIIGMIHFVPPAKNSSHTFSIRFRLSTLIFLVSLIMVIVGIRLAELNPPINPLTSSAQDSVDGALSQDLFSVIFQAVAVTIVGLISVIIALPIQNNDFNAWLIIAMINYLALVIGLLIIMIGIVYAIKRALPPRQLVFLFSLLLTTNLFISLTRTPLIHRYQTLWVLLAILVILSFFAWLSRIQVEWMTNLLLGLVVIAACVSVWHIGTGALSIANTERQRDLADSTILNDPTTCLPEANKFLDQIAPTITGEVLCSLLVTLDERTWVLGRQ